MRARRERRVLVLLLACALVVYGALALAVSGSRRTQTKYAGLQRQAAQLLEDCLAEAGDFLPVETIAEPPAWRIRPHAAICDIWPRWDG